MPATKLKIEIKKSGRYAFWRALNIGVVGLLVGAAIITLYFIQQSIFLSINNADAIVALQSDISMDTVNLQGFDQVKQQIEAKKIRAQIGPNTRDIFNYYEPTGAKITTSTTSTP